MNTPAPTAEPAPEFSRCYRLDEIGHLSETTHISATPEECTALAHRFGYIAIARLEAEFTISGEKSALIANGQLRAALTQPCIASAEPVDESIDIPFSLRFIREDDENVHVGSAEEMEIDAQEIDTITLTGDRIDMGEAVAETLALSVNPYPRSADADSFLRKMGVLSEEQASPFAVLLSTATGRSDQ